MRSFRFVVTAVPSTNPSASSAWRKKISRASSSTPKECRRLPSSIKIRLALPKTLVRSKRRFSRSRTRSRVRPMTKSKTSLRSGCPARAVLTRRPASAANPLVDNAACMGRLAIRATERSSMRGSSCKVRLSSFNSSRQRSPNFSR